jgi:WD40 repeat protein
VFRRDATVLAQPFDATRLVLSGGPVQIAGDVGFSVSNGRGSFAVSSRGTLIYFNTMAGAVGGGRARATPNWQFGWHDRLGRLLTVAGDPGTYGDMDLSPDGKLIAVTKQDASAAGADVWVIDWQRGVSTKLTLDAGDDMNPVWSPDGARIAFTSFRNGSADIFVKNANGVGAETALLASAADEFVEDWSKDGRYLVYRLGQGEFEDLYILPFDTDGNAGTPFPIVEGKYNKEEPQFSYDGKWLAYGSNESGTFEIYVTSFPAVDQKLKISNGGGGRPRWRRDSRELFYMRLQSGVMAADFTPGPKIAAGTPHLLYTSGATGADPTRHLWSVAPDGQRILMRTFAGTGGVLPTAPATFVQSQDAGPGVFQTVVAPAAPASNGLTVVRHWTAAFRKAAK